MSFMRVAHLMLLVGMCFLTGYGCAKPRSHPGPPVMDAIPPATADEPIISPVRLPPSGERAEHIRLIHRRMMSEAKELVAKQELPQAIQELQRLLALQPEEELETEGRWMLAQVYQKTGEWEGARDQYRQLASTSGITTRREEAQRNLQEIEGLLEQSRRPPHETQAVRLSLGQLPDSHGFDEGIKRMREDGVTTLLIDLGCGGGHDGVPTSAAPPSSQQELHTLLHSFVLRSHLQQVRVFVGVTPRCIGYWLNRVPAEWHDRTFDPESKTLTENRFFDIFHPAYQDFLFSFLNHLAEDGVDGLIFLGDHPMGPFDGLGESGLRGFQDAYQTRLAPSEVFKQPIEWGQPRQSAPEGTSSEGPLPKDTVFWRWAGWKAKERVSVLERAFHQLRRRHLTLQVGLEIHPHGLTDPVRALVEYAEDAMEAARRPFSFFYVRPEIDRHAASDQQEVIEKLRRISTKAVLSRLLPVLDDPRRVWVSLPADGRKRVSSDREVESSLLRDFPSGIGVVHDLRAFS